MNNGVRKSLFVVFVLIYSGLCSAGLLIGDKLGSYFIIGGILSACVYLLIPVIDEFLRRRKFFQKYGKIKWARACIEKYKKNGLSGIKEIVNENYDYMRNAPEDFQKYLTAVSALIPSRMKHDFETVSRAIMTEVKIQHYQMSKKIRKSA
jgi:hypothetical protein